MSKRLLLRVLKDLGGLVFAYTPFIKSDKLGLIWKICSLHFKYKVNEKPLFDSLVLGVLNLLDQ